MHGFFAPGFPKLARFQRHHDSIMEELRGLRKHLARRRSPEALPSRPGAGVGDPQNPAHAAQSPVSCSVSCWAQGALGAERGLGECVPLSVRVACGRRLGPEHLVSFCQDEQGLSAGLYTPKWFLQCFIGRTPFVLTLTLWDAYMLDGARVLTAMAYTVLRLHRKRLLKLPLEGLQGFLQDTLAQPWALEDEAVLGHLRASMAHLRRRKCDLPPPGGGQRHQSAGLQRSPGSHGALAEARQTMSGPCPGTPTLLRSAS
ncbi:USP6 N-terminal-like protein isoform X3 [Mustela putorius furo]|uniref:USP6 N-terminal-like protein isoform X3 n=1 Tax=Mustela putorius furo TaxID=9669 RepID=A0A8U0UN24_MUSPF|nr:USP6 N-terminal-like protein isoform X3 [Mustela putorius furo]